MTEIVHQMNQLNIEPTFYPMSVSSAEDAENEFSEDDMEQLKMSDSSNASSEIFLDQQESTTTHRS